MWTWRYNFSSEGVISDHKNALAYILCISVVDHDDMEQDELVYLASEFAEDERTQYQAYLSGLIEAWNGLKSQHTASKVGLTRPNGISLP